ncbi:MAG: hypothetical protein ACR2JC_15760 [Chloroflexota bacterium]|nr:MAG: hypothetical protein DLM70_07965 [Chloroflexota bacterium]
MEQRAEKALNYEDALRVIGRQLDAEPAYHVRILEVDNGFTVRYQPTSQQTDERTMRFTWDRLHDLVVFNSAGRGLTRKRGRYQGMWAEFPNGHQGFFRTLGATMDRDNGSGLAVDEVSDGVQISYVRADPDNSLRTQEHHTVLREPEIRAMIESAQGRRSR